MCVHILIFVRVSRLLTFKLGSGVRTKLCVGSKRTCVHDVPVIAIRICTKD